MIIPIKKKYYDGVQVYKIITETISDYDTVMEILKRFADEPSAQQWTQCREKTPESAGTYLCTCLDANRHLVTSVKWQPKIKMWNLSGARAYWKVIAWMPLPKPYKKGDADE